MTRAAKARGAVQPKTNPDAPIPLRPTEPEPTRLRARIRALAKAGAWHLGNAEKLADEFDVMIDTVLRAGRDEGYPITDDDDAPSTQINPDATVLAFVRRRWSEARPEDVSEPTTDAIAYFAQMAASEAADAFTHGRLDDARTWLQASAIFTKMGLAKLAAKVTP